MTLKYIRLWDPRFPDRAPQRIVLDDSLSAALVAAGVAADAGPVPVAGIVLGNLTLVGALTQGIPASGVTITGATPGSTITLDIPGLTVSGSGTTRTVSGTPTASGNINGYEVLGALSKSTYLGGVGSGASLLPNESRRVIVGNSIDIFGGTRSVTSWSSFFAGGKAYMPPQGNLSRQGNTTGDFINWLPRALAMAPAIVRLGTATNDLSASTPVPLQTIKDNLTSLIGSIRAAGAKTELPTTPKAISIAGQQETDRVALNIWIKQQAAADVVIADLDAVYDAATTGTTYSYDGIHPNATGAMNLGGEWARAELSLMVPDALIPASGDLTGNLNTTYDMAGTGGTAGTGATVGTGIATGYTVANASGATATANKNTLNSRASQQIVMSGTAASSADVKLSDAVTASFADGTFFELIAAVSCSAADGTSDPVGLLGFGVDGNGLGVWGAKSPDASSVNITKKFAGVIRSLGQNLGFAGSALALALTSRPVSGAAVNYQISHGPIYLRKIETVAYALPYYNGGPISRPSDGVSTTLFTAPTITQSGSTLTGNLGGGYSGGGFTATNWNWMDTTAGTSAGNNKTVTNAITGHVYTMTPTPVNSIGACPNPPTISITAA